MARATDSGGGGSPRPPQPTITLPNTAFTRGVPPTTQIKPPQPSSQYGPPTPPQYGPPAPAEPPQSFFQQLGNAVANLANVDLTRAKQQADQIQKIFGPGSGRTTLAPYGGTSWYQNQPDFPTQPWAAPVSRPVAPAAISPWLYNVANNFTQMAPAGPQQLPGYANNVVPPPPPAWATAKPGDYSWYDKNFDTEKRYFYNPAQYVWDGKPGIPPGVGAEAAPRGSGGGYGGGYGRGGGGRGGGYGNGYESPAATFYNQLANWRVIQVQGG